MPQVRTAFLDDLSSAGAAQGEARSGARIVTSIGLQDDEPDDDFDEDDDFEEEDEGNGDDEEDEDDEEEPETWQVLTSVPERA